MTPRAWRWLLGGVAVLNVVSAATGKATICVTLRELAHVETPAGRAGLVAGVAVFDAWWLPHLLDPAKRPGVTSSPRREE